MAIAGTEDVAEDGEAADVIPAAIVASRPVVEAASAVVKWRGRAESAYLVE